MFTNTQFGKFLDISQRSLSAKKFRFEVIANNIANAETPNFKRSEVTFENRLREALASEKYEPVLKAAKTHASHYDFFTPMDYRKVKVRRSLDWNTQALNNGNNVSIDQEVSNRLKTQLSYNLITRSVSNAFNRINIAIR